MTRVLAWVQHLLGTGHVERLRWIAEALVQRGAEVTFVHGGMPLPSRMPRGARVVELPPLRATDATFATLVDAGGRPLDAAYAERRRAALLDAFVQVRPHLVLLETYPFGRRALRAELGALLDAAAVASPRPRVVASVRDLLHKRDDPRRDAQVWAEAQRRLDTILVHGDPAFARLEDTFAPAADGGVPVVYTGYVRPPAPPPPAAARDLVVVSASGGEAGDVLLDAALEARALGAQPGRSWRVLVGPGVPAARFDRLRRVGQAAGAQVERHRDDFAALLARARVAVTQAGYNTVLDVLVARAPSVLVPFAGAGETEQRMRAARLAALGRAQVVDERDLAPPLLAAAIERAAGSGPMPPCPFDVDGARRAAEAVLALAEGRRPGGP